MESAVTADLSQLATVLSLQRTVESALDTHDVEAEIAERIREELDYVREAAHMRLFRVMLANEGAIKVPSVVAALSTRRLLTMSWLEGKAVGDFLASPQETRDRIGALLVRAWWVPLLRYGVVHGDPHLGNYTIGTDGALNLFDFGCVRVLPPSFIEGLITLLEGFKAADREATSRAFELLGFGKMTTKQVDAIAPLFRAIYEPLLEDRARPIMEGTGAGDYIVKFAQEKRERFKAAGVIRPPREFVFHQRAMVGLGAVLIQLGTQLNFHQLFKELLGDFSRPALAERQIAALASAHVP
jgi:predicted unusual protein kinase regulating ubiquinone biosynthesis (AarF/ABC1/UbiB family)